MFAKDKIFYKDGLGTVPAMCNIYTAELYLNSEIWDSIPFAQQKFIILHEYGHVALQTLYDEFACDAYASDEYFKLNLPLSQSIFAISDYLVGKKNEDYERVTAQAERCKNQEAKKKNRMTNIKIKLSGKKSTPYTPKNGDAGFGEWNIGDTWNGYKIYNQIDIKGMADGQIREKIKEQEKKINLVKIDIESDIRTKNTGKETSNKALLLEIQKNLSELKSEMSFRELAFGTGATSLADLNNIDEKKLALIVGANQNKSVLDYNKDMYGLQTGQNDYAERMYADKNKQDSYQTALKNGINPYTSDSFTGQLVDGWKSTSDSFMKAFGGGGGYQNSQMQQSAPLEQSQQTTYLIVGVVLVLAFLYFNKTKKK
jgi:hypothetical protein